MRSVLIAKHVPWPTDSGEKRRTLGLARALRDAGEVVLCAFAAPGDDPEPLRAEGIDVRCVPLRRRPQDVAAGLVATRSLSGARFWSPELAAVVQQACRPAPDAVIASHVQLGAYARGVPAATRVMDMHNIESSLVGRTAAAQHGLRRLVYAAEARALAVLERRVPAEFDLVTTVSQGDKDLLAARTDHPDVLVVANAHDGAGPLPPAQEPVVCFVALLSWTPNVDAATWFAREVWPRVTAQLPDARLLLVGRDPAPAVRALAGPTVEVTGTVPDVEPAYARSRVAVAPLRVGGGSRLKILEALALGRPVVSTAVGVEGLEDLVGRGVVVRDDAAGYADEIVRLLSDADAATALGRQGSEAVARDHGWTAATAPLLNRLRSRAEGSS